MSQLQELHFIEPSSLWTLPQPKNFQKQFQRNIKELLDILKNRVLADRNAIDEYIILGTIFRLQGQCRKAYHLHRSLLAKSNLPKKYKGTILREIGYDILNSRVKDFGAHFFEQALSLQRHDANTLQGLIQAYEFQQNFEKAIPLLEQLTKWQPSEKSHLSYVYAKLALQYLDQNALGKARRAVHKSLRADSSCSFAYLTLADVYHKAQKYLRVIKTLEEFIEKKPQFTFLALRRMEDAHYQMNDFPGYENTLRKCIRNCPDNFFLHYSLARHLLKKKRKETSMEYLESAISLHPLYANALFDMLQFSSQEPFPSLGRHMTQFLQEFKKSRRFICPNCNYFYDEITWWCNQCGMWGEFVVRYEISAP